MNVGEPAKMIVTLTTDELQAIVQNAVAKAIANTNATAEEQRNFTTKEAAKYLRKTPKALREHVARGTIVPDVWGGRGKGREHLFSIETLKRFAKDR